MLRASRIKSAAALRTSRITRKIRGDSELIPALPAQNRLLIPLVHAPRLRLMISDRRMTLKTRKPTPAAFESDGDDIEFAIPMSTASLGVNIDPVNYLTVDIRLAQHS